MSFETIVAGVILFGFLILYMELRNKFRKNSNKVVVIEEVKKPLVMTDFSNAPAGFGCIKSGSELCGVFDESGVIKEFYKDDPQKYEAVKKYSEDFKTKLEMYENV